MTPAIQEQTHPNLYPLAGDDRPLTLLKRGCANSGGFGAIEMKLSPKIAFSASVRRFMPKITPPNRLALSVQVLWTMVQSRLSGLRTYRDFPVRNPSPPGLDVVPAFVTCKGSEVQGRSKRVQVMSWRRASDEGRGQTGQVLSLQQTPMLQRSPTWQIHFPPES